MSDGITPLKASIDLGRIKDNLARVRDHVPGGLEIMAVVKCDAYGHGLIPVSRALIEAGAQHLVAGSIQEGIRLRQAGIRLPVLCLNDPLHLQLGDVLDFDLSLTVADRDTARRLLQFPAPQEKKFQVQLKVDTGLSRFGFNLEDTPEVYRQLYAAEHIVIQGVYSHLASTFKNDQENNANTRRQIEIFTSLLSTLEDSGPLPEYIHMGSSTGLLGFSDQLCRSPFNALRVGTLLYGFTEREHSWDLGPEPASCIQTRIIQVRDMKHAGPVGYHLDTFMPAAGKVAVINGGVYHGLQNVPASSPACVIKQHRVCMLGPPAMAQSMIDVSSVTDVKLGDRVILADSMFNAHELAQRIGCKTWSFLLPLLANARKTYTWK